jgi:hypothetical protein
LDGDKRRRDTYVLAKLTNVIDLRCEDEPAATFTSRNYVFYAPRSLAITPGEAVLVKESSRAV